MRVYIKIIPGILLLILFLAGCQSAESDLTPLKLPDLTAVSSDELPLKVVATTNIIGDVTRRVGGDSIDLTVLMGPGQDPHSYEPSSGDLAAVAEAQLILVNGWGLEEGLISSLNNVNEGGLLIPVSAGIQPRLIGGEEQGMADPHVWLDPHLALKWVDNLDQVLSALDPDNKTVYDQNAAAYKDELEQLVADYDREIGLIPTEKRLLITNHDSFGYFAAAYDFEIAGTILPAAGALAESSANDLAALVEVMNEAGICTVFGESTANLSLAETLTAELSNCDSVQVISLYTGSTGPAGSGAESYIGMMEANLAALTTALK